MQIDVKRIYDPPDPGDGQRVLVDRLWPRGVSKDAARLDLWLKEVAPSHELRKWFAHDSAKWDEFRRRYGAELKANPEPLERLRRLAAGGKLTLLFATTELERNHARFLKGLLTERASRL